MPVDLSWPAILNLARMPRFPPFFVVKKRLKSQLPNEET